MRNNIILGTVAAIGVLTWGWYFLVGLFVLAFVATLIAFSLGADDESH